MLYQALHALPGPKAIDSLSTPAAPSDQAPGCELLGPERLNLRRSQSTQHRVTLPSREKHRGVSSCSIFHSLLALPLPETAQRTSSIELSPRQPKTHYQSHKHSVAQTPQAQAHNKESQKARPQQPKHPTSERATVSWRVLGAGYPDPTYGVAPMSTPQWGALSLCIPSPELPRHLENLGKFHSGSKWKP